MDMIKSFSHGHRSQTRRRGNLTGFPLHFPCFKSLRPDLAPDGQSVNSAQIGQWSDGFSMARSS